MDLSTVLRHGNITAVPTRQAVMFMNVETGQYLMLQDTGREIWQLIDGTRSIGGIVEKLMEDYDVQPAECEADVRRLLGEMHQQGMVEIVG